MTSNLQIKDLELNVRDVNEEHISTYLPTYPSQQIRKKRPMSTVFESTVVKYHPVDFSDIKT